MIFIYKEFANPKTHQLNNSGSKEKPQKNNSMQFKQIAVNNQSPFSAAQIIQLQRSIGNKAVLQLLTAGKQPIQRMPKGDFDEAVNQRYDSKLKARFIGWFIDEFFRLQKKGAFDSTVEGTDELGQPVYKKMYSNYTKYIEDPAFTPEMLEDCFTDFDGYIERTEARLGKSEEGDISVAQGTYLVMKQSEMEAGLKTVGFAPCVAVSMKVEGDEVAFALAHLDSSTNVANTITAMAAEILTAAGGEDAMISATVMGGAVAGNIDDTAGDLSGPTLYNQVMETLDSLDAVTSIDSHQAEDSSGHNARIGGSSDELKFFNITQRDRRQLDPQYLSEHPKELAALKQSLKSKPADAFESRDESSYTPEKYFQLVVAAIEAAEKL